MAGAVRNRVGLAPRSQAIYVKSVRRLTTHYRRSPRSTRKRGVSPPDIGAIYAIHIDLDLLMSIREKTAAPASTVFRCKTCDALDPKRLPLGAWRRRVARLAAASGRRLCRPGKSPVIRRKVSRPRETRERTVPTGRLTTDATSSYRMPSSPTSRITERCSSGSPAMARSRSRSSSLTI